MRGRILLVLVLMTLGIVIGTLGQMSLPIGHLVSLFWPAMVVQVLGGIWFGGWGILAGVLFPIPMNLLLGGSSAQVLGFIPANIIQGLVPAILYRFRRQERGHRIESPDELGLAYFLVAGAILPAALGSICGTTALVFFGEIQGTVEVLRLGASWFIGDAIPAMLMGPILLWSLTPLILDYGLLHDRWWSASQAGFEWGPPGAQSISLRARIASATIPTRILASLLAVSVVPFFVLGLIEIARPEALPPMGKNIEAFYINLGVCLSFAVGSLCARSIYVPIRRLRWIVSRFARGDLGHRIPPEGPVEIARLAEDINRMAADLERSRTTLEEKVRERTHELEFATRGLEQSQQMIVESEKLAAVGRFAALVAHEVRNPLAVLLSSVALLETGDTDPALQQESIASMKDSVRRVARIVDAMTEAARPPHESTGPADLNATVEEVTTLLRGRLMERRIAVEKDLAPDLPAVSMSREKLRQVFFNLVMNAYDALPKGGTLFVATSAGEKVNYLDFADSGPGLPAGLGHFRFTPFAARQGDTGRGLGLFVCHQILAGTGGSIEVAPRPGMDAALRVTLPILGVE